jgi:hypothetical protein
MGQVKIENGNYIFPKKYSKNVAAKYFAPNTLPGCFNAILGKKDLVSDSAYDSFKDSKIKEGIAYALKKVDLSTEDLIKTTNVVYAPLFDYVFMTDSKTNKAILTNMVKRGNNNLYRYGFFNIVYIFYSAKQLLTVNLKYDIVNDEVIKSSSEEYFYKDVVGVSADEESFGLKTTGGPAAEIKFKSSLSKSLKFDIVDCESIVSSVRKILREVKE